MFIKVCRREEPKLARGSSNIIGKKLVYGTIITNQLKRHFIDDIEFQN
jgi:hypothetical protein